MLRNILKILDVLRTMVLLGFIILFVFVPLLGYVGFSAWESTSFFRTIIVTFIVVFILSSVIKGLIAKKIGPEQVLEYQGKKKDYSVLGSILYGILSVAIIVGVIYFFTTLLVTKDIGLGLALFVIIPLFLGWMILSVVMIPKLVDGLNRNHNISLPNISKRSFFVSLITIIILFVIIYFYFK